MFYLKVYMSLDSESMGFVSDVVNVSSRYAQMRGVPLLTTLSSHWLRASPLRLRIGREWSGIDEARGRALCIMHKSI